MTTLDTTPGHRAAGHGPAGPGHGRPRRRTAAYALGTIAFTTAWFLTGDHFFHVRNGILDYNWAPMVDGQSVWVAAFFLGGAIALWAIHWPIAGAWDREPAPGWASIAWSFVVLTGLYFASGQLGNTHPTALLLGASGLWVVRVLVEERRHRAVLVFASVIAGLGAFVEGLSSMAGLFDYADPDLLGVPFWLVACYLHAPFALLAIARRARALR